MLIRPRYLMQELIEFLSNLIPTIPLAYQPFAIRGQFRALRRVLQKTHNCIGELERFIGDETANQRLKARAMRKPWHL